MIYLTNGFSPSMLSVDGAIIIHKKISVTEFCEGVKDERNIINAIGHKSTAEIVNMLCKTNYQMNRISIKLKPGDVAYVVTLTVRLEEGTILGSGDIAAFYEQGKLAFFKYEIRAWNNECEKALNELVENAGRLDERGYDTLSMQIANCWLVR
ncbi:hypothetical protein [Sulfolobus spindle-shaped virus]|uniref:Uncharacterized protein n=1 Tax=Saccharolobus islandicus (strain M.14.25 / Kamchatka \|nr:DUF1874 domain-containing protein [Sulfolobus islandicus]ACP38585.1 hypothetical protein M1425_1840 [Sulfolobus islandicus M.14.25]AZG03070.1 hypothetical protein [Sulfolobus spindle-shaped virus]AZG03274.1 hypothetical protein [Sulfolobus spindle-shaped virus]